MQWLNAITTAATAENWFYAASPNNFAHILIIGRMNGWLRTNALKLLTLECGSDGGGVDDGNGNGDGQEIRCNFIVCELYTLDNNRSNFSQIK